MCGGMKYRHTDPETGEITARTVYFPRPQALIPIIDEGAESLVQWGRRETDPDFHSFDVPHNGWARLESIEKEYWQRFEPAQVLIPALEFCEKPEGFERSVWYPAMRANTYLKGLKLIQHDKTFVYVVTHPPTEIFRDIDRVPVIVNADFEIQDSLECAFEEAITKKPKRSKPTTQLGLFDNL